MKYRFLTVVIVLAFITLSCSQTPDQKDSSDNKEQTNLNADPVRDGVFIHITESYNDPHRVLMPMKMAAMMSNDHDVLVYMDIHAVELLVKNANDLNLKGFESFQTYLKILNEKKVGVYACPTCLEIAGFKAEDLMSGVQVAQKDKFFNFSKGRIITLDY